jgi:hypothetical protein
MQPHEIIPLDPDEFFAAHEYASMVSENEFLEEIPALKRKLKIEDRVLQFTNAPENRFGFAVMRFFRDRKHDKGWSFMMRFFAMMTIVRRTRHDETLQQYIKETKGGVGLHRAVFEAAAIHKLNAKFEFSPVPFMRAVKQIAKRMDSDEAGICLS